jgi:hypothetical protein
MASGPALAIPATLGLGGVGQVLGRLGYGRLTAVTNVWIRTAIVLGRDASECHTRALWAISVRKHRC